MDASDSRCRYIGKIIARDQRLVASRLYRMAVTRPQVTCCRYSIPSLGADLLGCINRTREKERKGKEALYNHAAYVLVRNHKSCYRLVPLRETFRLIRRMGKPHLQWRVVKPRADAICTGPKSNKKRRKGKQGMKQSSYVRNRTNPKSHNRSVQLNWQPFGGSGAWGSSTSSGRW